MNKKVEHELYLFLKLKYFDSDDIKVLKMWVAFVEEHGPYALEGYYKWDDHPLNGELRGYRSSCISNSGRIIYKIRDHEVVIEVIRITPNHNYKFDEEL
jgi:addiction module RelE/StbE family toxin